jgi:hypothetical protein
MASGDDIYGGLEPSGLQDSPEDVVSTSNALTGARMPSASQLDFGGGGVPPPAKPSGNPLTSRGLTRGFRNNNPGNLEAGAWTSSLPGYVGSDGRFAKFATRDQGMAALDRNLQSYGSKGLNTPFSIASTWAPGSEKGNNPGVYSTHLASKLGVGIHDPVDMSDPGVRAKIGQGIVEVENGTGSPGPAGAPAGHPISNGEALAGATNPPAGPALAPPSSSLGGLYTLAMLQQMFPQHGFQPVSYDPFAYLPKVST